jgi:hypothetical protein
MSTNLFEGIDLGELPIANELHTGLNENYECFPLSMKICADCGLGQVENLISPERLFEDYRYLSSVSYNFMLHARKYALELISKLSLDSSSLVLEIASNDGYFLRNFLENEIPVLGIEPAKNVAEVANNLGVKTMNFFFNSKIATNIARVYGIPKVIVANNVAAHVPDLLDFLSGIAILCNNETLVSIENPSILNILEGNQFDTIYHEHFSYLSVNSMKVAGERCGLTLTNVEEIPTHGGSLRYILMKDSRNAQMLFIQNGIEKLCDLEKEKGLLNPTSWSLCQQNVLETLADFRDWIEKSKRSNRKILGFGAAAKSSTLLNAAGIPIGGVDAIIDSSLEKLGRFMPTQNIPIISLDEAKGMNPNDIIIFPWNLKDEISQIILKNFLPSVRIWVAIPKMEELGH